MNPTKNAKQKLLSSRDSRLALIALLVISAGVAPILAPIADTMTSALSGAPVGAQGSGPHSVLLTIIHWVIALGLAAAITSPLIGLLLLAAGRFNEDAPAQH